MMPQLSDHTSPQSTDAKNPVAALSSLLADDMKQVNAIIMREMQSDVPLIPQLAGYLIASGGKRIRPLMTLASARLCGYTGQRAWRLAATVEFIHTATLLHDDVVDESDHRRGKESANLVFGNQASVLVGDFLFSRAFQLMVADGSLDVLRILSDASAIIAEGEVLQLATTGNIDTTMDDYLSVIESKTAALFAAACEVGPVLAGREKTEWEAMKDYGMALGVAFQIVDDVLDYSSNQAALGKDIGDDFKEGKMTLPVLLTMNDDNNDFWHRVIADKDQQEGDFETALELMKDADALSLSMEKAHEYVALAKQSLAHFPDGEMKTLLSDLADFTVSRAF